MDFRPNIFEVDPLPFLRDPSAFPPYIMRSFFKRLAPDWDGALNTIPSAPTVSFAVWDKQFRELINVVLYKNKLMTKPAEPKIKTAAAYRASLEEALTRTIIKKYGKSAVDMNKHYKTERTLTNEILRRLVAVSRKLDDYVARIDEDRAKDA